MRYLGAVAGAAVAVSDTSTRKDRILLIPNEGEIIRLDAGDARFLAKVLESAADAAEGKKGGST